ncbi:MAG TPA: hypothetical protein VKU02_33715 [Gemmataceae bacterium]|nr:hypothetical protein [Gemmataceae bacterium]
METSQQLPFYDRHRRELWVGSRLVKRFRQPASLQHAILSTFQELSWPSRIDDPLPSMLDPEAAKLRLREVIKRLNRYQKNRLLRFRGDGTGQGILWEYVDAQPAE